MADIKSFLDFPYDCPPAQFASTLVDSTGYPPGSVNLQVDISDSDAAHDVAGVDICNKLRFPMTYSADGASAFSGIALPRSNVTFPVALRGNPGDPFVISATFSTTAATTMAAFVGLELLPDGETVVEKLVNKGPLSPDGITLLGNAARACDGAARAARTATDAGAWDQLFACLRQNDDFVGAVVQLYAGVAADLGIDAVTPARLQPHLAAIQKGQILNRVFAEYLSFGLPRDVTFPYRLRCPTGCGPSSTPTPATPTPATPTPATPTPATPTPATTQQPGATTQSTPAQPTGDVPAPFLGSWTGGITQQNPPIPPFSLNVSIHQSAIGSTIASGNYTGTDPCSVHWTLLSATATQMQVNEVVDSGSCFNNIKVTLSALADGTLGYDFENGNGQGTLHH